VLGKEGWVLLGSELRFASIGRFFGPDAARATPRARAEVADPIPAIVDFDRQLTARGFALVFMPVPVRPLIYPESVLGRDRLGDAAPVPYLSSDQIAFMAADAYRSASAVPGGRRRFIDDDSCAEAPVATGRRRPSSATPPRAALTRRLGAGASVPRACCALVSSSSYHQGTAPGSRTAARKT
jgi:hypothetical protein